MTFAAQIRTGMTAFEHRRGNVPAAGTDVGQHASVILAARDIDQFDSCEARNNTPEFDARTFRRHAL